MDEAEDGRLPAERDPDSLLASQDERMHGAEDDQPPGPGDARPSPLSGSVRLSQPEHFAASYEGTPPWDIGRPQPALLALARAGAVSGRVLDVGCGTGEHALMAAALGLEATGVDAVAVAIDRARRKATERGLSARFLVMDVRDLAALGERFDTVLDCGLFHVLTDEDRVTFVDNLGAVVPPGGSYLMLCVSDRLPGDVGPRRITDAEIRSTFRDGWRVDSIEPATLETVGGFGGLPGWLARITRT